MLDVASLYRSEHDKVRRYLDRRIDRPDLVDDLAADVWLRAWERRDRYHARPGIPAIAWVMAITRNLLMDHFRETSKLRPPVSLDALGECGYAPTATDEVRRIDYTLALRAGLAHLTPKQYAAIVGRYYDGKKQRELTDIAPYHGVKKLQERALVNLRRTLGAA